VKIRRTTKVSVRRVFVDDERHPEHSERGLRLAGGRTGAQSFPGREVAERLVIGPAASARHEQNADQGDCLHAGSVLSRSAPTIGEGTM
jgi:hypothetical protein